MTSDKILTVYTDGASRNNPGRAAIGVVVTNQKGQAVATVSKYIGIATNNQAEYQAIIAGLELVLEKGAEEVFLNTDSELVVRQLNGIYKVKNVGLKPLYERAVKLMKRFKKCSVKHVARNYNAEADKLANLALDEKID